MGNSACHNRRRSVESERTRKIIQHDEDDGETWGRIVEYSPPRWTFESVPKNCAGCKPRVRRKFSRPLQPLQTASAWSPPRALCTPAAWVSSITNPLTFHLTADQTNAMLTVCSSRAPATTPHGPRQFFSCSVASTTRLPVYGWKSSGRVASCTLQRRPQDYRCE